MGARAGSAAADRTPALLDPGAPLTLMPGIGPASAMRLRAAGLVTVLDLVHFFPRRGRPLRELAAPEVAALGELVRLAGRVHNVQRAWLPGRRSMVTVTFAAADGSTFAAAFFNQPWLGKAYPPGQWRAVEGVLARQGRRFVLRQARVLPRDATGHGAVQLQYPPLDGVSPARLGRWIALALERLDYRRFAPVPLPPGVGDLDAEPRELLLSMHRPVDFAAHERARRHFAVREAVALFTAVDRARRARASRPAPRFPVDAALAARILARIPFELTVDQRAAVAALWLRLAGPAAMGVLLQGDVGTGKTAVAIATALAVLARGAAVAFLAPTELLAEQHHAAVVDWLAGSDVQVVLRTAAQRQPIGDGPALVFGTHALLAGELALPRLSLVIVDEQHRFGVQQRTALVHKGDNPHVLVMSATPIPRTLQLSLFGDLDVVALRARPPGRRAVPAVYVPPERWPRVLRAIDRAVRRGGRVFVVCPAVGEDGERSGAVRVHAALGRRFRCGLVHGRLDARSRQQVVQLFRDGQLDVLVGTTVLEVGVDVPAATLCVVVGAHRFGIATLHQLRGRVGRGRRRGLAILCGPRTARVDAVCRTADGFALAEIDLALRGGGELLGTQQSGFAELRALDPVDDLELLLRVRRAVAAAAAERGR